MKLEQLVSFFSHNPSAKLLRAQSAPYVIFFLNQHFKIAGKLVTQHSILQQQLGTYIEQLHLTDPHVMCDRAETYLTAWSTGDTRWLRRFFDAQHAEQVYQLTPHTEDVLKFLEAILNQTIGFVGTESRLSRIIETLSDIVIRGSDDPNRRLDHLYSERARIETEIQSIESGGAVATHSSTAIRERFADVVADLISLQGDFRAVEESFKEITRDVQKQQVAMADSRGEILGFALDSEDRLKEEDQGASFQAFVRLILSQARQDELERLVAQLDEISDLAEQSDGKKRLRNMIASLSAEAEKVLDTTRRLSAVLRRLLDSRASSTRQRLAGVLRELQTAAAQLAEAPPHIGICLRTELEMLNVHQRTFWDAPLEFDRVRPVADKQTEAERRLAFEQLAAMQRLDWDSMRRNVASCIARQEQIGLRELLEQFPPSAGAIEILGYIQLAHDDGQEVDESESETIRIGATEDRPPQAFQIPRVIFHAVSNSLQKENNRRGVLPR